MKMPDSDEMLPHLDGSNGLKKYETFMEDVLKQDLIKVTESVDRVYTKYCELERLQDSLKGIRDNQTQQLEMLVNIGCEVLVNVEIPDTSQIYIETAFGFFILMDLNEASMFLEKKKIYLGDQLDYWQKKSARIKAQIKLFAEALATVLSVE